MKQRKVISLPTNEGKIYRQILAFMNFMLNLTPQERDVLAELIKLNNEYEALPPDKRAKFILSTDMRKEIRDVLNIEEKQFNVILSRLKSTKKSFMGTQLLNDQNMIHPQLQFKPDQDGFQFEVNLIMTTIPPATKKFTEELDEAIMEKNTEEQGFIEESIWGADVKDPAMEYAKAVVNSEFDIDASKAPILEEETFDFSIAPPND